MQSKANKNGGKKGISKGKGNSDESTSQLGKDLSKFKCFICHKFGHYA